MSRQIDWTASNPGVELRWLVEGEPTPRYGLESEPHPGEELFESDLAGVSAPSLPAAMLPVLDRSGDRRAETLRKHLDEGEPSTDIFEMELVVPPSAQEGLDGVETDRDGRLKLPCLWIQGVSQDAGRRLQRDVDLVPGLFVRDDGEVVSLGHRLRIRQFLVPRPRIVFEASDLVADNTGSLLSMGSLLDAFVERFVGPDHALPHVQIATGYLYGRGLRRVLEVLDNDRVKTLQLLFSGKTNRRTARGVTSLFSEQFEATLGASDDHDFWRQCREAVEAGRLQLRVYTRAFLHAKLFLAWDQLDQFDQLATSFAVVGSSNVTGPGFQHHGNLELNITSEDRRRNTKLKTWFDARWQEAKRPEPPLLDVLDQRQPTSSTPTFETEGLYEVWRAGKSGRLRPPSHHLQLLAHLYADRIESFSVEDLDPFPDDETRDIQPSPEQRDGVRALVSRMLQVRVAFLADSVGLGKTITALGTAWYLTRLDRADHVAIVGPRKLFDQWREDARKIGMPHEEIDFINRHRLERMDRSEATDRLAGVDTLIVEEAHEALRNRSNYLWQHLRAHLREHLECKLLLVSATPWNNSREDIYNYLLLAWSDGRLLTDEYPGLAQSPLREYLNLFGRQSTTPTAGARAFDDLSLERYRTIFAETFLQRTRRTVERDYGREIPFPERRVHPLTTPPSDTHDVFYEQLQEALEASTLPYYQAFDALQKAVSSVSDAELDLDPSSSSGLFGSYLIQRFKRAESSFFALAVSLQSILDNLYAFRDGLREVRRSDDPHVALGDWLDRQYLRPDAHEDGSPETPWRDLNPEQLSPDEKVRLADVRGLVDTIDAEDVPEVVEVLQSEIVQPDIDRFERLLDQLTPRLERRDPKQTHLVDVVDQHYVDGHKPIAVAAFADTALRFFMRLVEHLPQARIGLALGGDEAWLYRPGVHEQNGLDADEWTDAIEAPDGAARRRRLLGETDRAERLDRSHVLDAFAPEAKHASNEVLRALGGPIDVLVGSEAISTGQNLQDSTALVQLDLPWNPMVIEQRIGRIDRRGGGRPVEEDGQASEEGLQIVDVYYCWSAAAVEQEVALRDRLRRKAGRAMEDTNFDEILLWELKERLERIRRQRGDDSTAHHQEELAAFLDERQRELVDQRTRVEGTDEQTGSEVDGMRHLAAQVEHRGIDLDYLPEPVVSAGWRADVSPRWLVSIRLTPLDASGGALDGGTFMAHLPLREETSEYESNLDRLVRYLDADGEHVERSRLGQIQWQRTVEQLDETLQTYGEHCLASHNERAKERLESQMTPASKGSASQKLKELAQRARDALQTEMEALSQQTSGRQRLAELKDRLEFLYQEALHPPEVYRLLNDTTEAELKRDLYTIADEPRRFLGDEFDVYFDRICGGRWERHQRGEQQQTLQMPEADGPWDDIRVEVLGVTYVAPGRDDLASST